MAHASATNNTHLAASPSTRYFGRDQALEQQAAFLAVAGETTNPCFPIGSNDTSAKHLRGTSNATACAASTSAILVGPSSSSSSSSAETGDGGGRCLHADGTRCGFLGEYQPSAGSAGDLYAFSNFAYTWAFLGVDAAADIAEVRARAATICSYDMSELAEYNAGLPAPTDPDYLTGYCFSAMYAVELLSTGYGFPETATPITVVTDVNGTEVSWALGSIIYQANALDWVLEKPADDDYLPSSECADKYVRKFRTLVVGVPLLCVAILAIFAIWIIHLLEVVRNGAREPKASGTIKAGVDLASVLKDHAVDNENPIVSNAEDIAYVRVRGLSE